MTQSSLKMKMSKHVNQTKEERRKLDMKVRGKMIHVARCGIIVIPSNAAVRGEDGEMENGVN